MKKNNISISIPGIIKRVLRFVKRFQLIIFFLIVSVVLFVAIVILLQVTNLSTKVAPSSGQAVEGTFDQATIDRLQKSGTSSDPSTVPGERKSPFVE